MLEAAMLGIPYTGHIPDFANGAGAAAAAAAGAEPLSPGLRTQRALKEEQDWAYQQSLQARIDVIVIVFCFVSVSLGQTCNWSSPGPSRDQENNFLAISESPT